MPHGKCQYLQKWAIDAKFKDWLANVPNDKWKASCRLCMKSFDVSNMGEGALVSHANSAKHKELVAHVAKNTIPLTSLWDKSSSASSSSTSASSSTTASSSSTTIGSTATANVSTYVSGNPTLDAEILWTLKSATSHYSFNSSRDISNLFQRMFPDSQIAKSFTCGSDKLSYYSTFGLGPLFKDSVKQRAASSDGFVLLFDEALNSQLGKKQMDMHVRMWENGLVTTNYYNSVFMGHGTAQDLFNQLQSSVDLSVGNLVQLSMDGPNVNWKVFRLLSEDIESRCQSQLLNIGSCGLHTIHNAFLDGQTKSTWDIASFFSSLYWLFKDTPARREDFTVLTGCTQFPLKHCPTRWIENIHVAERAIEIWPHVRRFIQHLLEKSKPLQTKSFLHLAECMKDTLLTVKLETFISVAKEVQPILVRYQGSTPMLPFMAEDLYLRMRSIMRRCVKDEVISASNSIEKLVALDPTDDSIYLEGSKVDIGFKASRELQSIKTSPRQLLEFRQQAKTMLRTMLGKLIQKSPIKSSLVRNLQWMNPAHMIIDSATSIKELKVTLGCLVDAKQLSINKCDTIIQQFSEYFELINVRGESLDFSSFDRDKQPLDKFWFEHLSNEQSFSDLWTVMKKLLLLSHGQAQVERGFSINNETMVTNLKEPSLVAQRHIINHVHFCGGIKNISITPQMRLAVAGARTKYRCFLADEKLKKDSNTKKRQQETALEELDGLKKKRSRLQLESENLLQAADKLSMKAETTNTFKFVIESNALRRSAKEKFETINKLSNDIDLKMKELSSN